MIDEFNKFPKQVHKSVQDIWKELGPFPMRQYIAEGKLTFDETLIIKEETLKVMENNQKIKYTVYG